MVHHNNINRRLSRIQLNPSRWIAVKIETPGVIYRLSRIAAHAATTPAASEFRLRRRIHIEIVDALARAISTKTLLRAASFRQPR